MVRIFHIIFRHVVYLLGMVRFCWSFWIRVIFPFVIHSSMLVSSRHTMYAIMARYFPNCYFFYLYPQRFQINVHLGVFYNSPPCSSFFNVIYLFSFSIMFPLFPKRFCFFLYPVIYWAFARRIFFPYFQRTVFTLCNYHPKCHKV